MDCQDSDFLLFLLVFVLWCTGAKPLCGCVDEIIKKGVIGLCGIKS
jgi:hypothetical protein